MKAWLRTSAGTTARLRREEEGAVLVETIIILPVMIVFLVGILEFGALLFAKLEVETGLRDAARYIARCQSGFGCSELAAQNIAVFGKPVVGADDQPRVAGWSIDDVEIGEWGTTGAALEVSTSFDYAGSPLIGLIGLTTIPVSAFHQDRYIGW